jgi:hypothetical protein
MDEHVLTTAAIRRDEPVTLGRIKPLYSPAWACFVSPSSPASSSLNRGSRSSQAEPGLAASVLLDISCAATRIWSRPAHSKIAEPTLCPRPASQCRNCSDERC